MDYQALILSLQLAGMTVLVLIPLAILVARALASSGTQVRLISETLISFPLLLPPTVLGYALLQIFNRNVPIGAFYENLFGRQLVFSFDGMVAASMIVNLPFAILPIVRSFLAIDPAVRESAITCGASSWFLFRKVELPLAKSGIVLAAMMTFAHTMGEFGIVLMIGGNIPGVTRTAAIALYDSVQAFDEQGALYLALALFGISFSTIIAVALLVTRGQK